MQQNLQIRQTKDKVEYTVNAVGSPLFLQFSVESQGEAHTAACYVTVYYWKKTDFTPLFIDEYWTGISTAHQDYLDSLMLVGEQGLYRQMESVYNCISNKLGEG